MNYAELLKSYIKNSRLTLEEICGLLINKNETLSREHLSRLQNGKTPPPASEHLNRSLAEITGGDPEALILAAYIEKAPDSVKDLLFIAEAKVGYNQELKQNGVLSKAIESMKFENKKLEIMAKILEKYNFDISDPKKQKMLEDMIEFAMKHSD